jgi:hypothetical protein
MRDCSHPYASRLCPGLVLAALLLLLPTDGSSQEFSATPDAPQELAAPRPDEAALFELRLDDLYASFSREPDIADVQAWAVERARAEPERAADLLRLARARGALPLIRLRGRYGDQSGTKWDELNLMDSRDRDSEYTLDLWLEWDLAELASGPDALRAVREGRALAALRQGVINQVNIAYFDRRRLLAETLLADPGESRSQSVLRRLRIDELIATLDGLTGGRWTAAQAEVGAPPLSPNATTSRYPVAKEPPSEPQGEDPDSGLRVPVHPADRPSDP